MKVELGDTVLDAILPILIPAFVHATYVIPTCNDNFNFICLHTKNETTPTRLHRLTGTLNNAIDKPVL